MAHITRAERETVIRRSEDDKFWDCYSCVPADVRRLRKIAESWGVEVTEMPYDGVRVLIPRTSASSLGPRKKSNVSRDPQALLAYNRDTRPYLHKKP